MNEFNDKKATIIISIFLCLLLLSFFCFAMLFTAAGYHTFSFSAIVNKPVSDGKLPTIIIDAGHGGEDPGAVIGDVKEKDINLQIALILGELFESNGYNVVYTRKNDVLLYKEGQENRKKHFDLFNRVSIASEYENAILISIHINMFSSPKYSGLQVFYSNENSYVLAKTIQEKVRTLQPKNNRAIKNSGNSIYLLDKYQGVGVLIECGFISNDIERKLLCETDYQRKMALTIFTATAEYINGDNK